MPIEEVISYTLKNRPGVKQAYLDQEVGEREIRSALSGWLPQVNANGSYNYNIKQQVNTLTTNGETSFITFGSRNTSALTLQADQTFLDAGLIQASKTAKYYRKQYLQNTESAKITAVVDVSKAFFDILTSKEQIKIIEENISRVNKQLKDAKSQYESGLVDKTDYQRAQISLSNSLADQKRNRELLKYKYSYLKSLMGYPQDRPLEIAFDDRQMEKTILADTLQLLDYNKRVEYRLLVTKKELQSINTNYNKLAYLPKLSGFVNYGLNYLNDDFSSLYNKSFPTSVAGLTLSIPIFQGTKRTQEIRKSRLLERRADLDLENSRNEISSQYQQAMASYKAGLNDWKTAQANMEISKQVYDIIKLQYDEGIKSYLDLMTADTDLKTSQLNYLNALYALLSAKLDLQQSLGNIITP